MSRYVEDQSFIEAMSDLPAAVSVVTTSTDNGEPRGATVSSMTSLSRKPPMLLVCLDSGSETLAALECNKNFVVNVLSEGQEDLALRFASKGSEKFQLSSWSTTSSGIPVLDDVCISFDCEVKSLVPAGDHSIVVGSINNLDHDAGKDPVVYHRRRMFGLRDEMQIAV